MATPPPQEYFRRDTDKDPREGSLTGTSTEQRLAAELSEVPDHRDHPSQTDRCDACVAALLLVVTAPLFLMAMLMVWLSDRRPLFWTGERLGKDRKPFQMIKFRSLVQGAAAYARARPLTEPEAAALQLEHRCGRFLRDSRLDELPQLWHVIKGDMALIGPRPVRPAVYQALCREISGYDRRFRVKPGLIGYSQVFTPHGTDKRIRKRLDNRFVMAPPTATRRLGLLGCVLVALALRLPNELIRLIARLTGRDRRRLRRVPQSNCRVSFPGMRTGGLAKNLTDTDVFVQLDGELPPNVTNLRLERLQWSWSRMRPRRRIAYCRISRRQTCRAGSASTAWDYVLTVEPATVLNHYRYQKYFLKRAVL